MTICERLSDRMPMVASGAAQWAAEERDHLATCPECAAEWRLIGAASRLGATAPPIDAARVAAAVRARLAAEPRGATVIPIARPRQSWLWGLAAAAVVVLAVSLARRPSSPGIGGGAPGQVLSELDELSAAELETVLAELSEPTGVADGSMGDLSTDELQRVLRDWES